ncbi:hypothetical protein [Nocardia sp. NPDC046763]
MIDSAAHTVTATIPVGKGPVGVAVDRGRTPSIPPTTTRIRCR